jgi:hypothetical protein
MKKKRNTVAAMLGCESSTNTPIPNEGYQTPRWTIEQLIEAEGDRLPQTIWEPCAGGGSIADALRDSGRRVIESDLVPNRASQRPLDFLKANNLLRRGASDAGITTNPPWSLADEMIRHAIDLKIPYAAWLLKAFYLNYGRALMLVNDIGYPARIWGLTKRPDFRSQGGPPIDCAWFVWDARKGRATHSVYRLLGG